jgi:hypothetical protein
MKPPRGTIAILAAVMFLVWGIPTADVSAQSIPMTTQELTNRSDIVTIGTVRRMQCEWNAAKSRIFTRVTIAVREFLKGDDGKQQITIVTPGGEIGEVGELYCGAARFRNNEEVVVFARKKGGQDHEVVGGDQGRIPVIEDRSTGMKTVLRGIRLDDFRSAIKSAAQAARPGEKRP